MKLFGWVLQKEWRHEADLRVAEDHALSRLVELLSKKDSIYLETVTLEGDNQTILNSAFLGSRTGLVIRPKQGKGALHSLPETLAQRWLGYYERGQLCTPEAQEALYSHATREAAKHQGESAMNLTEELAEC